jgi:hypothetical protein
LVVIVTVDGIMALIMTAMMLWYGGVMGRVMASGGGWK